MNGHNFADLGWDSHINTSSTFVGVLDLGSYLDELQTGNVNVQVNDDTGIDWGMFVVSVTTPISDPVGPTVVLDGGGTVIVNSAISPISSLQVGDGAGGNLLVRAEGALDVRSDYTQLTNGKLTVELSNSSSYPALNIVNQRTSTACSP